MHTLLFAFCQEKIVSAQKQVVGGMKYKVSMIVHESNCPRDGRVGYPLLENGEQSSWCSVTNFNDCEVVVYERMWENYIELTSHSCSPSTYERHYAAGLLPYEPEGRSRRRAG